MYVCMYVCIYVPQAEVASLLNKATADSEVLPSQVRVYIIFRVAVGYRIHIPD